jgi:hypothetical protein
VNHFVEGALEAAGAGGIDGDGDESGTHATEEGADHFEAWGVGEEKTVLGCEAMIFEKVTGDRLGALDEGGVAITLDRIAVDVEVGVEELVGMFLSQPIELIENRNHLLAIPLT